MSDDLTDTGDIGLHWVIASPGFRLGEALSYIKLGDPLLKTGGHLRLGLEAPADCKALSCSLYSLYKCLNPGLVLAHSCGNVVPWTAISPVGIGHEGGGGGGRKKTLGGGGCQTSQFYRHYINTSYCTILVSGVLSDTA